MIAALVSALVVALLFAAFGLFRAKMGEGGACSTCELEISEQSHET